MISRAEVWLEGDFHLYKRKKNTYENLLKQAYLTGYHNKNIRIIYARIEWSRQMSGTYTRF